MLNIGDLIALIDNVDGDATAAEPSAQAPVATIHGSTAVLGDGLPQASPSVRKFAREPDVPLDEVKGSGFNETDVFGDAGFVGVHKRPEAAPGVRWHVSMLPGKRRRLDLSDRAQAMLNEIESIKAKIRGKVERPFRVLKQQFGMAKVRYRGLAKNTAQLKTLFAPSNLWMARRALLA